MSTQYTTEPPPTATVLLHTTAGPLTLSVFATQTPLASRNFLQHVLDGTYSNNIFHRISPGFVIQTGDPTGTGSGGTSIYEDREFEGYDVHWARELGREVGEKIHLRDEVHSRLKFNRRGLVGMARTSEGEADGGYGSQFFITLGDCRRELDGKCTMFGRVEGEGIYNVVKIAEGELVEGTERPVFPEKITRAEVLELPKGEAWQNLKKRERVVTVEEERPKKIAKKEKKKGGKALLSFGDDEDGVGVVVRPKKAKFNTTLIAGGDEAAEVPKSNGAVPKARSPPPMRRKERSPSPKRVSQSTPMSASPPVSRSPEASHRRKPSFHESTTQLPIRDPEVPSRSFSVTPEPASRVSKTKSLNDEIAALKASMRRDVGPAPESTKKKSALEQMIPATSTRGRKRPRPGDTSGSSKDDAGALKMLNAFRARLDGAAAEKMDVDPPSTRTNHDRINGHVEAEKAPAAEEDDEAALCDLHFIANCQSCSRWDQNILNGDEGGVEADEDDRDWMGHALSFEKDRLGKDLTWRKKTEEELVVIDPREKEKEIQREQKGKRKAKA